MSPPTYHVTVDFDDDLAADPGEDITADVLRLEWRLGFAAPYEAVAAPVAARVTIRNPTRAYSPEVTANPYAPGKRLCIQSHDGLTLRTHFTGFITHVEPTPGDQGERLAVIHAAGPEAQLMSSRARLPPQVEQRADQVIAAVIGSLPLRQPGLAGYWLLGLVAHSELDASTRLAENYPRTLETGQSIFTYTADTWAGGIPALEAIRQMAEAERGRFFVDRDGALVFHNRHHTLAGTGVSAAFADDMEGMDYQYGVDLANHVAITFLPRRIGASNTTLWTLENAQKLAPGEEGARTIIARYRDPDGRPVGALEVIPPVAGVDYHANTVADGSGEDCTAQVGVLLAEAGAGAATLTLRNTGTEVVYLLPGMTLRGTPLVQGDVVTLERTDWTSVSWHGLHDLRLNLPAIDSLEEADQLARFELSRRANPRGVVQGIQVSGVSHLTQVLERTLFDRITVAETQTGHAADYFIIAEEHAVDLGGLRHTVSWLLEPAAASAFWIIGTSLLDQDTILAY